LKKGKYFMKTSQKTDKSSVVKTLKGKVVTLSEENGKPVAILELNEQIVPKWDMSPKVLYRMAFTCETDLLKVGEQIEVIIRTKE
jgi:hypothetical protein